MIEHQPTDEEVRGPNGVNLIATRQLRTKKASAVVMSRGS